ncbi:hypothetical protein ABZ897_42100 [Nonomuraea sp. NPDC046802]|uniref:hypothetical protein n=1 Tax=Nonomuraea sp. NPDC046802 TaxID=3154919 RepID=UPI0033DAF607
MQSLLMGLFAREWMASVVLNGMVRGSRGMADEVVRWCGEVMSVWPDHLDHLIPVIFINTCDQARFWTAGEAKV